MTWTDLLIVTIAVAGGALVQGTVGFGVNLVAGPVLILVDPTLVPGPALVASLWLTILLCWRDRTSIDIKGVRWALIGRVPGTVAGTVAVATLPVLHLQRALGVVVLVSVGLTATHASIRPSTPNLLFAGLLSGFFTSTAAIGGPPMALVYQRSTGPTLRGTLAGLASIGSIMAIVLLAGAGRFGGAEVRASMLLVPGLVAGFLVSRRLAGVIDGVRLRRAVLVTCTLSGVAVLIQAGA